MKREIKFRGKHSHNGEWAYGNLIVAENGTPYIFPREICEVDGHHLRQGDDEPHWVDRATVGQFTGLTDKNGKEIFEGDICRLEDTTFLAPAEVYMDEQCFWGLKFSENEKGFFLADYLKGIEIIGNIHDNPELLKSEIKL